MIINLLGKLLSSWNPISYVKSWLRNHPSAVDTKVRESNTKIYNENQEAIWQEPVVKILAAHHWSYVLKRLNYISTTTFVQQYRTILYWINSFCNNYFMKRSTIGLSDDYIVFISKLFATNNFEAIKLATQNRKTCKLNYTHTPEIIKRKENLMSFFYKSDDTKAMVENHPIDSTMNMLMCWWKNVETNCKLHFLNHYIDAGVCFTFNQDRKTLTAVCGMYNVFGPPEFEKQNLNEVNTRTSSGLKLLINAKQNESCGSGEIRYGAGFFVLVHDQESATSPQLQSTISLGPGYDYKIYLQPANYDQKNLSESLGKCTSNVYNFLQPNSDYNREACIQACFLEYVWTSCNCLVMQESVLTQSIIQHVRSVNEIKKCNFLMLYEPACVSDALASLAATNPNIFCPKCKQKCFKTRYDYKILMKKLSLPSIQRLISSSIHTNESIEKNFLLVSFSLGSMDLVSVRETQQVTVLDLLMDISNILGLFLGFSVVTVPEILYYIYLMIVLVGKHVSQ